MMQSERLRMRLPVAEDLDNIAALNADSAVMAQFPNTLSHSESDAFLQRIRDHHDRHGFGVWVVECIEKRVFLGLCGLNVIDFSTPALPDRPEGTVEILWRLKHAAWGQMVATEAAGMALEYAFSTLDLPQVVAFTARSNLKSEAVMQRLKMLHAGEFDHPALDANHPLSPHVLYSLKRSAFA